jgi:hypothetical protein
MGLLDELKKRAAEKEAQRSANIEDDARADEIRAVALPALFRIHANLAELVKQLRILDEETPVSLKIPGLGEVSGFQQRDYSVSAEGTPPHSVTLRCALRLVKVRPLEMTTAGTSPTPTASSGPARQSGAHHRYSWPESKSLGHHRRAGTGLVAVQHRH